MADVVHKMLEEMIPELEELGRAKLFSEAEIKAIVKKRTNFEYQVQRKGAQKQDFFRYIQYEMNLDMLKKARKKRLGIRKLPELSEFSGVRRIHYLYNRMLHRYAHDIRLWLQYIDFSMRSKSFKSLNRTFARALQLHPANEGIWIMAASWEFNHNQNMQGARALMSRAVRLNKHSTRLWHEFFRLELFYMQKIRERMALFGIENSALVPKSDSGVDTATLPTSLSEGSSAASIKENAEERDKDLMAYAEGDPMNTDGTADSHFSSIRFDEGTRKEKGKEKDEKKKTNPFLEGAIPTLIYRSAIKELPKDFKFREEFLAILRGFKDVENIKEVVYGSMLENFSMLEDCWDCLARRKLSDLLVELEMKQKEKMQKPIILDRRKEGEREEMDLRESEDLEEQERHAVAYAIKIYEEAVKKLSTQGMWKSYVLFCEEQLQTQQALLTDREKLEAVRRIISVCSRAEAAGVSDEEISENWINALLNVGEVKQAMDVAKKATDAFPSSPRLWILRIRLIVRQKLIKGQLGNESGVIDPEVDILFAMALDSVPAEASLELRAALLELCMVSHVPFETILTQFKRALAVLPRGEGVERLKDSVITHMASSHGLEQARKFYESAFDYPPVPLSFYHKCIAMEKLYSAKVDYDRVKALYHKALSEYGETSTETWLDFVKLEADLKDFKAMQTLYWQAKKRLTDPSTFVAKYDLIK